MPDRKPRAKTARAGSFGELRSPSLKSETAQVGNAKARKHDEYYSSARSSKAPTPTSRYSKSR